jgi:hypothetical protein
MNAITCPTPPHLCIHAPTGSHRQACPSSASSHERYYMPHPTPPPRCVQNTTAFSRPWSNYIYIYYDQIPHVPGNHFEV